MAAKVPADVPRLFERAIEHGWRATLYDQHGEPSPASGRPPAAVVLGNDDESVWVPVEDLPAVADLLLLWHVNATRARLAVR